MTLGHRRSLGPRQAAVAAVMAATALGGPVAAIAEPNPAPSPPASAPEFEPLPTPSASPAFTLPVRATLTRLDPKAPQPGQRIAVVGRLTNTGTSTVHDLAVQLRMNRLPVSTRDQIDAFATGGDAAFSSRVVRSAVGQVGATTLAPGAATSFRLDVPGDALTLGDEWRVFELGVDVLGSDDAGATTVGRMRTFLPWAPLTSKRAPIRLAWLWPLVDRPHRAGTAAWTDDDLAAELRPGGTLSGLATTAARAALTPAAPRPARPSNRPTISAQAVPVAWVVDPLLVEDATLMSSGYQVATAKGDRPGTGTDDAQRWLASLRDAVRGQDAFETGYADPDMTATVHHGLSADTLAAADISSGLPGASPLVWPPGGLLDSVTLEALAGSGAAAPTLVLSDRARPLTSDPGYTPSAQTTVTAGGREFDALLTDSRLGAAVSLGADDPVQAGLAEQRFLAETLMIVSERPLTSRDVVIAPERRWRPTSSYAAALLADSGRVPWIQPTRLSTLLPAPRSTVERAPLDYPDAAAGRELPAGYLAAVRRMRSALTSFATALPRSAPVVTGLDRAILRTESSAWRDDLDAGVANRENVDATLSAEVGKLRIASARGSLVTLTSRSGRVPVTIANDLNAPARVRVRLDAGQRLTVAGGGEVPVTVPAGTQYTIEVRARARTAGVFPLRVTLLAPDGTPLGVPVTLSVRSTVYGTLALAITGAATAVLFLAVVVRLIRRAVRTRHEGSS